METTLASSLLLITRASIFRASEEKNAPSFDLETGSDSNFESLFESLYGACVDAESWLEDGSGSEVKRSFKA